MTREELVNEIQTYVGICKTLPPMGDSMRFAQFQEVTRSLGKITEAIDELYRRQEPMSGCSSAMCTSAKSGMCDCGRINDLSTNKPAETWIGYISAVASKWDATISPERDELPTWMKTPGPRVMVTKLEEKD